MSETTDQIRPFSIKAMPARVADEITEAARTSSPKLTVGQLVEKVWDHWKHGAPVPSFAVVAPTIEQVATALNSASVISHLGETLDKGNKAEANRLCKIMLLDLKLRYRFALGMKGNKPPAIEALIAQAEQRLAIAAE